MSEFKELPPKPRTWELEADAPGGLGPRVTVALDSNWGVRLAINPVYESSTAFLYNEDIDALINMLKKARYYSKDRPDE